MASILKVDTIQDQSGNNIINESGDTITIGASGDTINVVGTLQNNGNNAVGITEADQWRLTASITTNTDPISANLERVDNTGFGKIGTGMSVASGIWTFPSTGLWRVEANMSASLGATDAQTNLFINQYISGTATGVVVLVVGGSGTSDSASGNFLYNVTDTATRQITFSTTSMVGSSVIGNTNRNDTYFTFTRLGDSV